MNCPVCGATGCLLHADAIRIAGLQRQLAEALRLGKVGFHQMKALWIHDKMLVRHWHRAYGEKVEELAKAEAQSERRREALKALVVDAETFLDVADDRYERMRSRSNLMSAVRVARAAIAAEEEGQ